MTVEIGVITAIIAVSVSAAGFMAGRLTAARTEGRSLGAMATEITHIRELTERIEAAMQRDTTRTENKFLDLNKIITDTTKLAGEAHIGQKSAHKRIDDLNRTVSQGHII